MPEAPSSRYQIKTERPRPDVAHVKLHGLFDYVPAQALHATLKKLFELNIIKIALNLENVLNLNSTTIGVIIDAWAEAQGRGGKLIVTQSPPKVFHLFELMGLTNQLSFAADLPEALGQLE